MMNEQQYVALWYLNARTIDMERARDYKQRGMPDDALLQLHLARVHNRMMCAAIHTGRV
jgi:hypothetical protein